MKSWTYRTNSRFFQNLTACLCVMSFFTATSTFAQPAKTDKEPLATRIDRIFGNTQSLFAKNIVIDDATFARRVSLDLTGMPLSTERLRSFLADKSADKRSKLVDELIDTPQATRHLATWLSLTLMERRPAKISNDDLWMAHLMDMIRHDKPLDALTRDMLTATGEDGPKQVTARFLMDRDAEPNLMTRDVGRVFLGRDMQCNQCHDHPIVDGYLQSDYQSLLSFFTPTSVAPIKIGNKQLTLLSEKAGGKVIFDSVFVKDDSLITGPRLPGLATLNETRVTPGDEYDRRQTEGTSAKPRVSRRAMLADSLIASPTFRKNWANRLWGLMFGRGIVHPPDFSHPENPPVDAQLLETLGDSLAENGYRMKPVLKAIVLSQPYQRPFDMADDLADAPKPGDLEELNSQVARYTAELTKVEASFVKAKSDWHKAQAAAVPVQKKRDPIQAKLDEFGGKLDAANIRTTAIAARLKEIEAHRPALIEAKAAADKAVAALGGDKELTAGAKAFSDKLVKNDTEKAALIDEESKKAVERRLAEEQVAAFRGQARSVDSELDGLMAHVRQLEDPFRAARQLLDDTITRIAQTKNEIAWQTSRAKYLENQKNLKEIGFQLAQIEPMEAAARKASMSAKQVRDQLEIQIDGRQRELVELNQKIASGLQSTTMADQASQSLKRALTETQNAARLAPMAQFGQLLSQMQSQIEKINAQMAQDLARLGPWKDESKRLESSLAESQAKIKTAGEQFADISKKADLLTSEIQTLISRREKANSASNELTDDLVRQATERFQMAALKPLSPESLAWSIMKTTKVYDSYWAAETEALDKAKPPTAAQKADLAWNKDRAYEIEAQVFTKLRSYPQHFATLYGAGAGQPQSDFFATADQALYLANGGAVASWCIPSNGNPADGIVKAKTAQEAAEALYFGVLGRQPDKDEIAVVAKGLATATDKTRNTIASDMVWGLMTSPEYRFNH